MTRVVNLRSDTVTKPTDAMRKAMARAEVGDDYYRDDPTVRELENTHNAAGGCCLSLEQTRDLCATAASLGLGVHLDGARIFNAAVSLGLSVRELTAPADSVTVCLTKGLGCPVGALALGSRDFVEAAGMWRQVAGGGVRQGGSPRQGSWPSTRWWTGWPRITRTRGASRSCSRKPGSMWIRLRRRWRPTSCSPRFPRYDWHRFQSDPQYQNDLVLTAGLAFNF